jgi:hypothetical protein
MAARVFTRRATNKGIMKWNWKKTLFLVLLVLWALPMYSVWQGDKRVHARVVEQMSKTFPNYEPGQDYSLVNNFLLWFFVTGICWAIITVTVWILTPPVKKLGIVLWIAAVLAFMSWMGALMDPTHNFLAQFHPEMYLLCVVIYAGCYLVPSFIAAIRNHRRFTFILLLNLFAGWTVIGWIAALIWAFIKSNPSSTGQSGSAGVVGAIPPPISRVPTPFRAA